MVIVVWLCTLFVFFILEGRFEGQLWISSLFIPYSGKLSREKTFANFVVLHLPTKLFSAKIDGHTHT